MKEQMTISRTCTICGEKIHGKYLVEKNTFYCPNCGEGQFVIDPEPKRRKKKGFLARVCGK